MKALSIWLLSLAFLPGLAWAQQPASLQGNLAAPATADTLVISWSDQGIGASEQHVSVQPDARGNFRLQVPIKQPTMVQLTYGELEAPLFLEPGDALTLKAKSQEANSLRFGGGESTRPAVAANEYLQEFEERFIENDGYQVLPENITLLEPGFLSFLDYRRTKEQAFLKQASRNDTFTDAFLAVAQAEIDYSYADDRLTYADLREQTVPGQPRLKLSDDYYNFVHEPGLLPGNEIAVASARYQDFLLDYVHYQAKATGHGNTSPDYFPQCYRLADQLLHGSMRPLVLGRLIFETIRFGHIRHVQAMLDNYTATAHAPAEWTAQLRRDFTSQQNHLIGSSVPALPLRQVDGTAVSLSDYRGKLVYVMFWDTHSAASQREIPYVKPLTTALAGLPITVVLVALDDQPEQWRRRLLAEKSSLTGVQTHLATNDQTTVRQQLAIERMPGAMLLAEDGTLLDLHARLVSSRPLQEDLKAAIGRAAAYRAVSLAQL